jgi:hypothetical protein
MPDKKKRVDFNADVSVIESADSITEVTNDTRTDFIIDAIKNEIRKLRNDEDFRQEVVDAYYDGRIDHSIAEDILGVEEATRMKLLKESIDRVPPEPQLEDSVPTDEEFYDGKVPTWKPDERSKSASEGT